MLKFFFLIAGLLLNALANFVLKLSALKEGNQNLFYTVLSIFLFFLGFVFYKYTLKYFPISIAYPIIVGSGFLIISILAHFFLKEPIGLKEAIGILFIFLGITLIVK